MIVVVRLFVDKDAQAVMTAARAKIAGTQTAHAIEPYPKEPGWSEVSFQVSSTIDKVRDALGTDWDEGGDAGSRYAVWNPGPAKSALLSDARIRFANLEEAPD